MNPRRDLLVTSLLAAAGLLPAAARAAWTPAAFDAKNLTDAARALGGGRPVPSRDVTLAGPDIAENGAAVEVSFGTPLGGVQRLALMVEKNPNTLAAVFELGDAIDAQFTTRVKMAQSSNVFAVAFMADGRVLYAAKDIRVTIGGCG